MLTNQNWTRGLRAGTPEEVDLTLTSVYRGRPARGFLIYSRGKRSDCYGNGSGEKSGRLRPHTTWPLTSGLVRVLISAFDPTQSVGIWFVRLWPIKKYIKKKTLCSGYLPGNNSLTIFHTNNWLLWIIYRLHSGLFSSPFTINSSD